MGRTPLFPTWAEAADYLRKQNEIALPLHRAEDWQQMARRMFRATESGIVANYDPAIATAFATGPVMADPWERWHDLARDRPLLLLRGALSDLLTAEDARLMIAGHARAQLCEIPDVGHAPMLNEPDALAAIGQFLDELP